ncbi:MAG: hypothetical protein ABIF19_09690 [Planctomycetota bacterium]
MKKILLTSLLTLIVVESGCTASRTSTSTSTTNPGGMRDRLQDKTENEEKQRIAKGWEDARAELRRQLETDQEYSRTEGDSQQAEIQSSELKDQAGEQRTSQVGPKPTFTHLRLFKPNNRQNGYGADIFLRDELSEQELVSFVKSLADSHDPVVIRIFISHIAYAQELNGNYGPEYDSGYILVYIKNFSGSGAFRGCNEIRWMQATGKFSSKFGTKTRL